LQVTDVHTQNKVVQPQSNAQNEEKKEALFSQQLQRRNVKSSKSKKQQSSTSSNFLNGPMMSNRTAAPTK
jgi:hypothetical protein